MRSPITMVIFLLISGLALVISWRDLLRPQAHGFPRFFAFETLTLLTLDSVDRWFEAPFSALQILSWLLLILSLLLAVGGFSALRALGAPQGGLENTTRLVTTGPYRLLRHPLYASLFYFGWGVVCKAPTWAHAALALGATAFLTWTALLEEQENLRRFGEPYAVYMRETKRFIPWLL